MQVFKYANLTTALSNYSTSLLHAWLEFYQVQGIVVIKEHFNGN